MWAPDGSGACVNAEKQSNKVRLPTLEDFGITLGGSEEDWNSDRKFAVWMAAILIGNKLAQTRGKGETATQAFGAAFSGGVNITWGSANATGVCATATSGGCTSGLHQINFWSMTGERTDHTVYRMTLNVVHEFGHVYDWTFYDPVAKTRASSGMPADIYTKRDSILRPNNPVGYWTYQQHPSTMGDGQNPSETFADMFIAWVYAVWNTDPANSTDVSDAQNWAEPWMPEP